MAYVSVLKEQFVSRNLLKYITHINHTAIPIQLLESLLETDSTTKEADVNTFLAVLCDYSLATISGRGDNRVISIHSVTVVRCHELVSVTLTNSRCILQCHIVFYECKMMPALDIEVDSRGF
jgi:hypothetical protein